MRKIRKSLLRGRVGAPARANAFPDLGGQCAEEEMILLFYGYIILFMKFSDNAMLVFLLLDFVILNQWFLYSKF